jgi:hypothetical protein
MPTEPNSCDSLREHEPDDGGSMGQPMRIYLRRRDVRVLKQLYDDPAYAIREDLQIF